MPQKLIFMLYRQPDIDPDRFASEWGGERHVGLVGQLPGLVRWVQNRILPGDAPNAPDGIGELWFDTDESLQRVMTSPEMAAAVEDAKRFVDMERTYALRVNESAALGRAEFAGQAVS